MVSNARDPIAVLGVKIFSIATVQIPFYTEGLFIKRSASVFKIF
jgi:hypothetical protein